MPAVSIKYPDGSILENVTDARTVAAALLAGSRLIGLGYLLVGYGLVPNIDDWLILPDPGSSKNAVPLVQYLAMSTSQTVINNPLGPSNSIYESKVPETNTPIAPANPFTVSPIGATTMTTITATQVDPTIAGQFSSDGRAYRLMIANGNVVDTGATYAGCSIQNPSACAPMQFATIQDAYDYANEHNEIPVLVGDAAEAWDVVHGVKPVPVSFFANLPKTLKIAAAGFALFFLTRKKR